MRQWMMKQFHSKRMPYIMAFFLPLLVMVAVCINHGIYPFGENSFLHIDMYHQYAPFFMEFLHKLREHGSLLYSWNLGIGSDFLATYVYYLASPVNWLVIFCSEDFLIEFMTVLVLLKIALSGLFFARYLGYHFKKDTYLVTLVSMFYALSGFFSAYSWNIMWLDCIMLAPLILLALERLVYEGKAYLYAILLTICILSNFYISIMVCIFLVLYFFLLQAELTKNVTFSHDRVEEHALWRHEVRKKRFCNYRDFLLYSLLAGAGAAILLIPEMIALGYSGSGDFNFPDTMEWYFSIFAELARQCVSVTVYTGRDHWPNIYCGVAVLPLFVLYLVNQKISWQKKLTRTLLLGFFLLSFSNNWLDFIWHGMHFPDSLPARQSFLYILVLLAVCFDALQHLEENKMWHILVAGAASAVFLAACYQFTDRELIDVDSIAMTGVLLAGYLILLAMAKIPDRWTKKMLYAMTFVLAITEASVNMDMTGVVTTDRTQYTQHWDAYRALTEETAKEDTSFYRTEKWARLTKNESSLTGYRSASLFSSLMNYSVGTFYRELGMEGGKNFYCYNGATPLLSAMLSVKYMMTESGAEESPLRTLLDEKDGMYLYENKYSLPLGFMVSSDLEKNWDFTAGTAVFAQNALSYELGADSDLLMPFAVEREGSETVITVEETGYIYATYMNSAANTITADIGGKIRTFSKCSHMYLLDLGWCTAGTVIRLTSDATGDLMATAYRLNLDSLNAAYTTLQEQTMTLDSYTDTTVNGHITVKNKGKLVFSIPNEAGWTLYVDGKETGKELFMDSLIAVTLEEGMHEIALRYETPGLRAGAAVSAFAAVSFLILVVVQKKRKKQIK